MDVRKFIGAHAIVGLFLVVAGGALLLENLGVISIGSIWQYWPLIFVGLGIARMWDAQSRREQGAGLFLLLLGLWLTVSVAEIGGLTFGDTWPALFIAIGVSMLWKSLPAFPALHQEKENPHGA
jgi:hypothetical protein